MVDRGVDYRRQWCFLSVRHVDRLGVGREYPRQSRCWCMMVGSNCVLLQRGKQRLGKLSYQHKECRKVISLTRASLRGPGGIIVPPA